MRNPKPGLLLLAVALLVAFLGSVGVRAMHPETASGTESPTTVTVTKECSGLEQVAVQFQVGTQFSELNQDCGDVYHVEVSGSSVVINEHLRGTAIATISCKDSALVPLAQEGYTLQLVQNHDNACTIINHAPAPPAPTTVTVTKECSGLEQVAVQFQVGTQFSELNQDCGDVYHVEVSGSSVVINEHLRGTAIATISCNDSALVALAPEGYTLQLVQNHDNACTIINHAPAPPAPTTVTVTKECSGLEQVAVQFQVGTQFSELNQDCGDVYHVEVSGSSVVINEHLRGTAIATISCNDSALVPLAPEGYTLQLVQNHDNACTIINHAPAPPAPTTVTVTKECSGLEQVAVQFQVGTQFSELNQDCGDVYHVEVSGSSVVINEHLRGTAIATISCNDSALVPLAPEGYTLQLVQNHDNACTIINHAPAPPAPTTVTVTKECSGLEQVAVQFQVGTQFSELNQDCGDVYHVEVSGSSVVINEHLRGTAIATISCNDSALVALAPEGYTLQLVQNHDNACTIINHAPPAEGCTLTQGYWKNHSALGPAPYDETWAEIGESTTFFLSGKSYLEVLRTAPAGNAYYQLAHQYIAAQLNMLSGASVPADVQAAFDAATTLLETKTPAQIATLKGSNALRAQFISLAGTLGAYNEGALGPGHCPE